jgi:hypothetical protein
MKAIRGIAFIALMAAGAAFAIAVSAEPAGRSFVELEGGIAFSGYNDVQIPSKEGTKFSLTDDVESPATPAFRARVGHTLFDRHTMFATVAPFTVRGNGTLEKDITFAGKTFAAGTKVDSTYRFDSYRLTYRYTFADRYYLKVAAGITGKIRSATIALMSDSGYASRNDLGFVPLVNVFIHWKPHDKFGLVLDLDALASPYGRAEDALFALQYEYSPNASLRLGYRVLEGGSDGGGSVYTFALVNYATVGLTVRF